MLGFKSATTKRLDGAKHDLAAARAKAAAIAEGEEKSLESSASHAAWRVERDAVQAEVDRLEKLITALHAGAEAARVHDADEALRERIAAARALNVDLAEKMRTDGVRLSAELVELVAAVSAASFEADAVNKLLSRGEAPVATANAIARGTSALLRKNISEKTIELWVRADNGSLVGHQDRVEEIDSKTGSLHVDRTSRVKCTRRRYRQISYHPDEPGHYPEYVHSMLRLPRFDGPGVVAYDGARMIIEHAAAASIEPTLPAKKSKRPVQMELIPAEPMPDGKSPIEVEHERLQEAIR